MGRRKNMEGSEKRLLNMKEFREYSGVGRNNAFRLVHEEGFAIRVGKKILVDRVAFDLWVDRQTKSN